MKPTYNEIHEKELTPGGILFSNTLNDISPLASCLLDMLRGTSQDLRDYYTQLQQSQYHWIEDELIPQRSRYGRGQ